MANKNLGEATKVGTMREKDSVLIEVDGSIRRLTLKQFADKLNEGQTQLLYSVAWGIPILSNIQTSPQWGMVGNLSAYASYKSRCGRYLMDVNGRAAKLNINDSSKFLDGSPLDESKGNVMVIAPRLYYLYQTNAETSIPYLWMSEYPISEHFIGQAGNGMYNVIGAYKGALMNDTLVSRSGIKIYTSGLNIKKYWDFAQKNGGDFGLFNYHYWKWLFFMSLCETGGNTNVIEKIGAGVGGSTEISFEKIIAKPIFNKTGGTINLGDKTGNIPIIDSDANPDSCHVSVLGVEDLWNLQFEMIQNIYFGNKNNPGQDGTEVFIYNGNRIPSENEVKTHPDGSYKKLNRATTGGYIKDIIKGDDFDILTKEIGGSSNSYYCSYCYNSHFGQILTIGGSTQYPLMASVLFQRTREAFFGRDPQFGARLAYYGDVSFVEGKSL